MKRLLLLSLLTTLSLQLGAWTFWPSKEKLQAMNFGGILTPTQQLGAFAAITGLGLTYALWPKKPVIISKYTKKTAFHSVDYYAQALMKDIDNKEITEGDLKKENKDRDLDLQSKVFKFTESNGQQNKFIVSATMKDISMNSLCKSVLKNYPCVRIQNYNENKNFDRVKESKWNRQADKDFFKDIYEINNSVRKQTRF